MRGMDDVRSWEGKTVIDSQGKKIGKVDDVYFDEQTGQPEWALVQTGMFGKKENFVPIEQANMVADDTVQVPYEESMVKNAPKMDSDQELSQAEEAQLADYYGLQYSQQQSGSGLPQAGGMGQQQMGQQRPQAQGQGRDSAMTRSEEELRVGKARRPSELVRLHKYVVTENVQTTVPVSHEEVRVEREPISEANRDAAMSGQDIRENVHEETLYTEEPVVEKRVVPKERVRLDKETVAEERQVSDQVRKEQVEVEREGQATRTDRDAFETEDERRRRGDY